LCIVSVVAKELDVSASSLLTDSKEFPEDLIQKVAEKIIEEYVDLTIPAAADTSDLRYRCKQAHR
jgi:hypothetical protein